MGGISTPPCASSEGGFLQGTVCFPKHLVPFNPAILIGSPTSGQDGDPDGVPFTLGKGNGDGGSFVAHRSVVWCGIPLPLVPILSDQWGDLSPLGGQCSDRHNSVNLTLAGTMRGKRYHKLTIC